MRGKKTGGRKPGSKNKITGLARDAIVQAAEDLGGAKRLANWAKEDPANEGAFWTRIYPRLMPLQVTGENGGPVQTEDVSEHNELDVARRLAFILHRAARKSTETIAGGAEGKADDQDDPE